MAADLKVFQGVDKSPVPAKGKVQSGETVVLNGQRMLMTVEVVIKGVAKCCWHDDGKAPMSEHYPVTMLTITKPDDLVDDEE